MATLNVGVVLSGCGVLDGSEIHEATSILLALDKCGAQAVCMAPDIPQSEVVNHAGGKAAAAPRRVLDESARIARGKIRDMANVQATDLDALLFPGGFGAVKNLSTFAKDGLSCQINEQVERLMLEMHQAGKPIGLTCIAPAIAARVFGSRTLSPTITIGDDADTAAAVEAMGARHQKTGPTDICVDPINHLVTTACYMNEVGPWTVYQGVQKMVEQVLRMATGRQ